MKAVRGSRGNNASWLKERNFSIAESTARQSPLLSTIVLLVLCVLSGVADTADAQSAYFSGVTSTINSNFSSPYAVALDTQGDIYVADAGTGTVKEIVSSGGSYAAPFAIPTSTQFVFPVGVAVDAVGDVYVSDYGTYGQNNGQVYEIVAGSTSTTRARSVGSGWMAPSGIAIDGSGNVFVVDNGANSVSEITGGVITATATGFAYPTGVAVDGNGYVYVADWGNGGEIYKIAAANLSAGRQVVASGLNSPNGIAVDASGNLWLAENGTNTIDEVLASSGSTEVIGTPNFNQPEGVAIAPNGNVIVADSGNGAVDQVVTQAVNLGASPIGIAVTSANSLLFTFAATETIRAPVVLTQGAGGSDFSDAGTGTCTITGNPYAQGSSCTVNVKFDPSVAGARYGAVELLNTSGAVIATAYVYGTGNGPQLSLSPVSGTSLITGLSGPQGIAADGNSDLFVADGSTVTEFAGPGPLYASPGTAVGSGFSTPANIAMDGQGNLFVADSGAGTVSEIVWTGSGFAGSPAAVGSGFSTPTGVAVDASGNVFVADSGYHVVKEVTAGSAYSVVLTLSGTFTTPSAVAVDSSGDLFVADSGSNKIWEYVAVNGAISTSTTPTQLAASFTFGAPQGLAVIGNGTLLVTDTGNNAIEQILATGGYVNVQTLATGLNAPTAVAVDGKGNIYFAGAGNKLVARLDPPTLTFANTDVNATSGPQSVRLTNIGVGAGSDLTFTVPGGSGTNPLVSANFTLDSNATTCPSLTSSSSTGTLTVGGPACAYAIDFAPTTVGNPLTGSLVIADNNPSGATQTISLSGTAVADPTATVQDATEILTENQAASFTPVVGSGGTSAFTYSISPALPTGLSLNASSGLISGTPTVTLPATPFTITITDTNSETAQGQFTLTVNTAVTATQAIPTETLTVNQAASFTPVTGAGGTGSLGYSISPALPAGLNLNASSGLVSGTPTAISAAAVYSVTVTDHNNATATASFSLAVVAPTIAVSPATLPAGQVNVAYSQTLSASGGTPPYTYLVTAGALPAGLVLSAGGVLSGTPTAGGGPFNFTVTATDSSTGSGPFTGSVSYSVAIAASTTNLTFAAIPAQTYGNGPFTVSASSGSTGAITYSIVSGPATINASTGAVMLTGAGSLTIGASQAVTANYSAATVQTTLVVAKQVSQTTVTAGVASINPGQSVTLTATVTPAVLGAPTGTVTFFNGTTALGSAVPLTNGTAQLIVSSLVSGANSISAMYSGDANFLVSSGSLSGGITVAPLAFTLSASPASQTGVAGTTFVYSITVTPTYGSYPGTVSFAASGLPSGATAVFSPSTLAANAGQQTLGMAIVTASTSSALHALPTGGKLAPVALALLLLPLAGTRRMRRHGKKFERIVCLLLLALAGVVATTALSGCGTSSYIPTTSTSSQKYSITITGTSGNVQQTTTIDLSLQ